MLLMILKKEVVEKTTSFIIINLSFHSDFIVSMESIHKLEIIAVRFFIMVSRRRMASGVVL